MRAREPIRIIFSGRENLSLQALWDWQRGLRKLFKLAGIPDGHAHRFGDSFVLNCCRRVPLERLSVFLGHQSLKVTERHDCSTPSRPKTSGWSLIAQQCWQ
jgi:integrase